MTGYTRKWTCVVCDTKQESIDYPKMCVCDSCLRPVAQLICKDEIGVPLDTAGVDQEFWMRKADRIVLPMMRRWRTTC